jgi:hypothetical protein
MPIPTPAPIIIQPGPSSPSSSTISDDFLPKIENPPSPLKPEQLVSSHQTFAIAQEERMRTFQAQENQREEQFIASEHSKDLAEGIRRSQFSDIKSELQSRFSASQWQYTQALKDIEQSRDQPELRRDQEYENQARAMNGTFEEFMTRITKGFNAKAGIEDLLDDSMKTGIEDLLERQNKTLGKARKNRSERFEVAQQTREAILQPLPEIVASPSVSEVSLECSVVSSAPSTRPPPIVILPERRYSRQRSRSRSRSPWYRQPTVIVSFNAYPPHPYYPSTPDFDSTCS